MKVIATADWHIRGSKPRSRTDKDYAQVQAGKIKWILDLAVKENALILNGGDVLDSDLVPQSLLNWYLAIFSNHTYFQKRKMVVAVGNHDQNHHRLNVSGTSIGSFFATNLFANGHGEIVTADWGGEPSGKGNVLVTHRTITEKPNSIIKGSIGAEEFVRAHDYKLIVSGDYHVPHVLRTESCLLINPGCIMRQNSDQTNLKPRVYLIDTDTLEYEEIYIPVKDSDSIFDLEFIAIEKEKKKQTEEMKEAITDMVSEMKEGKSKPCFYSDLDSVIGAVKPRESVKQIISEVVA